MSRWYYPRMRAVLTVPTFLPIDQDVSLAGSEAVDIEVRVLRAHHVKNNAHTADELEITCIYKDVQLDPRIIRNGTIRFWMDDIGPQGKSLVPTDDNLRFAGAITDVELIAKEGDGFKVNIKALDYMHLFLMMPITSPEVFPPLNETAKEAYARLQRNTGFHDVEAGIVSSSVANLQVDFRGNTDPDRTLSTSVNEKLGALGVNQIHHHAKNVWDVWVTFCQAVGGWLTYVELDKVVVIDVDTYFSNEAHTRFTWGENLLDAEVKSQNTDEKKGIVLTSYDPVARTYIESFYPPVSTIYKIKQKRTVAADKTARPVSDYEVIPYPYAHNQDRLDEIARVAYVERARQDLQGKLTTHEIIVPTTNGDKTTIFDIRPGDAIRVNIGHYNQEQVISLSGFEARVEYLKKRGYSDSNAARIANSLDSVINLIARSADGLANLAPEYHVQSIAITLDGEQPSFSAEINFHSFIHLTGDAIVKNEATQA